MPALDVTPKVLVAEPDPLYREALREVVSAAGGAAVMTVEASCRAVTERAAIEDFDLLLIDFDHPGMDGLDGLARLRRLVPALPVVAVSVDDSAERIRAMLSGGAAGYLAKGMSRRSMAAALLIILGGRLWAPGGITGYLGPRPQPVHK